LNFDGIVQFKGQYARFPKKKGNNMSPDFPFDFFPPLLAVRVERLRLLLALRIMI
jgi:hypothetical protein